MTINNWLTDTVALLTDAKIETPQLDSEILLATILDVDRSWLIAHSNDELSNLLSAREQNLSGLQALVNRREKHEPLAYILGYKEFYGRRFYVDKRVLVPRPESEIMIELLLNQVEARRSPVQSLQIVDVGTGSGNLIITSALEHAKISNHKSKISFLGIDISVDALKIARKNAKNLNAEVEFKHFDLINDKFKFSKSTNYIFLANLPYVPKNYPVSSSVVHEPSQAIYANDNGLGLFRKLFASLSDCVEYILTESMPWQHETLIDLAQKAGYDQVSSQDFIQVFKRQNNLQIT